MDLFSSTNLINSFLRVLYQLAHKLLRMRIQGDHKIVLVHGKIILKYKFLVVQEKNLSPQSYFSYCVFSLEIFLRPCQIKQLPEV